MQPLHASHLSSRAHAVERWFARHQRPLPWRDTYDPYRVWVSEVMLQQTRMEVVLPYFERFVTRFPDLRALAQATDDEVMAAWSGLGYYRRAKMLRAGAAFVVQHLHGVIPSDVETLLSSPGIGRYTAGAIRSIAFDERAPIVDGNVARVLSRVFMLDGDAWPHATALVDAARSPRAFNQGLMELGALVCKPRNPACLVCPLHDSCAARAAGRVDDFPPPKPKKETRALRIPLYLVRDRRGRVLMRRASGALMDSMYHLPHGDTSLFDAAPLAATRGALLGTFRHTVTTRRIEFVLYEARVRGRTTGFEWIDIARLHDVPHPSYVRKALKLIG
ncbi:MAG TPA: A/G-specific adenine glycosylase [Thermoanaerobaculia bacterium]|nr:A/G-specific adenine glycosylase [Thermoanaerobaculia bacterium]